jgi:predicted TIM-barrel fold metal-dependent hydrolase
MEAPMLTRRTFLAAGLVAGASTLTSRRPAHAIASQPSTKVSFDVPPNSCDCAVHVYDPKRFAYWQGRSYTAEPATVPELRQFLKTLRLERVIIVQATPYGTDNACVMASVRELSPQARGVAIIDEKTSEASLDAMHAAGVRGVRLNLGNVAVTDAAAARQRLKTTVDQLKTRSGWSLQTSASTATYEILKSELMALPMPLVIDHFGEVRVDEGVGQRGFPAVIELVKSGKAYVKISNADTLARRPDFSDMTPFAKALIEANAQRVVWGTAWPHPSAGAVEGRKPTDLAIHRPVDDGRVMNMLPVWAPDAATRKMVLVDNPARLYGF